MPSARYNYYFDVSKCVIYRAPLYEVDYNVNAHRYVMNDTDDRCQMVYFSGFKHPVIFIVSKNLSQRCVRTEFTHLSLHIKWRRYITNYRHCYTIYTHFGCLLLHQGRNRNGVCKIQL